MSYKIAVASSDGVQVDETFGAAKGFLIYEVTEDTYHRAEERVFSPAENGDAQGSPDGDCSSGNSAAGACGQDLETGCENGAGSGCGAGSGSGCGGGQENGAGGCGGGQGDGCGNGAGHGCGGGMSQKVELISDCRCVVCKKIGFQAQKQLERKAISSFDVSCPVEEALSKISGYFYRIDNHKSLRAEK